MNFQNYFKPELKKTQTLLLDKHSVAKKKTLPATRFEEDLRKYEPIIKKKQAIQSVTKFSRPSSVKKVFSCSKLQEQATQSVKSTISMNMFELYNNWKKMSNNDYLNLVQEKTNKQVVQPELTAKQELSTLKQEIMTTLNRLDREISESTKNVRVWKEIQAAKLKNNKENLAK